MKVSFEAKFAKDLRSIKDAKLLIKIKELIVECKEAKSLAEIKNVKKLQSYDAFYRIRLGDYRVGLEALGNELVFARHSAQHSGLTSCSSGRGGWAERKL